MKNPAKNTICLWYDRDAEEAARFYAKLHKMGFNIEHLDVGGGLGVDYDGSRSAFDSSTNYSLQEYTNDIVYYLADDGFYAFDGLQSVPIGREKIDRTFWSEVATSYLYRITSAVDPVNKIIYWAYPGPQSSAGAPNRILAFNYDVGRWSRLEQDTEIMVRALATGYTLEQLDAFGTLETLPFSLDIEPPSAAGGGESWLARLSTHVEPTKLSSNCSTRKIRSVPQRQQTGKRWSIVPLRTSAPCCSRSSSSRAAKWSSSTGP